jgi:hypothetical protein
MSAAEGSAFALCAPHSLLASDQIRSMTMNSMRRKFTAPRSNGKRGSGEILSSIALLMGVLFSLSLHMTLRHFA